MDVTRGCRGYEAGLTHNWNGNVAFVDGGDETIQVPSSIQDVCDIVRENSTGIRVVGRGHSFTPLAKATSTGTSSTPGRSRSGTVLSLQRCNKILEYQPPSRRTASQNDLTSSTSMGSITVEGGTTYTEVIQFLRHQRHPGSLPNLPSCPQFTVAGAIATGTHGSGLQIHNLSAHVAMLEFIKADGTRVSYDRDIDTGDTFTAAAENHENNNTVATIKTGSLSSRQLLEGCRVHLGCLGVISSLRLDVLPYYEVEAVRYDDIPLDIMIEKLPDWWTRCNSLSVWTSGFGRGVGKGTCWATFRRFVVTDNNDGGTQRQQQRALPVFLKPEELGDTGHICEKAVPRYCTNPQHPEYFHPTGRGPWYDYLTVTMDKGEETCMSTKDLQAEFFVPLEHTQAAIRAVWAAVSDWEFSPPWGYEYPSDSPECPPKRGMVDAMEFRQVKGGDGAWLSPHHAGDCLGIHISFNGDPTLRGIIQDDYLPVIEEALKPFDAKPHWGKLATPYTYRLSQIQKLYAPSSVEQFQRLCYAHDPDGKFRNEFITRALFGSE